MGRVLWWQHLGGAARHHEKRNLRGAERIQKHRQLMLAVFIISE
nr:hypothetical protein [Ectobacillus panaciterrae]